MSKLALNMRASAVAKYAGVSIPVIYRAFHAGVLKAWKPHPKAELLFHRDDVLTGMGRSK